MIFWSWRKNIHFKIFYQLLIQRIPRASFNVTGWLIYILKYFNELEPVSYKNKFSLIVLKSIEFCFTILKLGYISSKLRRNFHSSSQLKFMQTKQQGGKLTRKIVIKILIENTETGHALRWENGWSREATLESITLQRHLWFYQESWYI